MDEDTIKEIINDAVANLVSKDHMDTLMEKLQNDIEEMINSSVQFNFKIPLYIHPSYK